MPDKDGITRLLSRARRAKHPIIGGHIAVLGRGSHIAIYELYSRRPCGHPSH